MPGKDSEAGSRTGRFKLRLDVVVAILAVLGFFGINQFTDLFSSDDPPEPAPLTSSAPAPPPPVPTTSPTASSDPAAVVTGPAITVSPAVVAVGQRYGVSGSGFAPGAGVTIESGGFFVGFDQADASGRIEKIFPAIDQGFCATPTVELTAVVDDVPVASATARFCS